MSTHHIIKACALCGSTHLVATAQAEWSVEAQQWVLLGVESENPLCMHCGINGPAVEITERAA